MCDDLTLGEVVIIIIDIYTPCISTLPNAKEVHELRKDLQHPQETLRKREAYQRVSIVLPPTHTADFEAHLLFIPLSLAHICNLTCRVVLG